MRYVAFCLAVVALSGCQMQLPVGVVSEPAVAAMSAENPAAAAAVDAPRPGAPQPDALQSDVPQPIEGTAESELAAAFDAAAAAVDTPPKKKSLLAFLKPKPVPSPLEGTDIEVVDGTRPEAALAAIPNSAAQDSPSQDSMAQDSAAQDSSANSGASKKGFFARLAAAPEKSADAKTPRRSKSTVAPGEAVSFGVVGVTCETRKSDMGTQVDQYPRNGRAIWRLYDTAPSSTGPRTQYITGFSDGCARQITAALVVFGSPEVHETHRYSKANKAPWSQADNRYETIKTKYCGVAKKAYCPSDRLSKLGSDLAFVSVYPRFGGYDRWLEMLLHKGRLETQQVR